MLTLLSFLLFCFSSANTTIALNVITEFVAGYLYPGKPIANVVFKVHYVVCHLLFLLDHVANGSFRVVSSFQTFGYMTLVQSIDLTADLKTSSYLQVKPRSTFIAQIYGTILGAVVRDDGHTSELVD